LSQELDADWFIHHDADEFRESPWAGTDLRSAIRQVDALGYNAIDFSLLDFWPTDGDLPPGSDVRAAFPYCEPGQPYNRVQVRCWKKTSAAMDLVSSGGHEAAFDGRRVFPIRFLLRHYPIRGQAHGERKVFADRLPRFADRERQLGWHVQYDTLAATRRFVRSASELTRYDAGQARARLQI
jgi:hypothetical protein